jgi:hypothetical protein
MVTREEGLAFAQEYGCLFIESSAKTRQNVEQCFKELALKVHLHGTRAEVLGLIPPGHTLILLRVIISTYLAVRWVRTWPECEAATHK